MTVTLKVYEADGTTYVDDIETARKIGWLSDGTSAGTLTFEFSAGDESSPTLVRADRIVKVDVDGTALWAGPVRAQSKTRSDGDRAVVQVTCVGMRALCETALVYPEVFASGFPITNTRLFGFMSTGKDVSGWDFALSHGTWTSQPFATLRPTLFPDDDAELIWSAHTGSPAKAAAGDVYFVKDFTTDEGHLCTLFASADDELVVWVDGIELVRREGPAKFDEFDQVTFVLPAGMHRVAILGTNLERPTSVGGPSSAAWVIASIRLTDENGDLPSPTDETWSVDVGTSTSGTFALLFDDVGQSGPIPYNASAATVETAIEDIHPAIDVSVTGSGTVGDPWVIVADGAQQAGTPHLLVGNGGNLVGGTLTVDNTQDGAYAPVLAHTDTTWRMEAYPASRPGVTAGFILDACLSEAQARVSTVDALSWTFDAEVDSTGVLWEEELEMAVGVGTPIEQVVGMLFERGFWNRFLPDGEVELAQEIGLDLTAGVDLIYAPRPNVAEVGNTVAMRHDRDAYRIDRMLVATESDLSEIEAGSPGDPPREAFFSAGGFANAAAFADVGAALVGRYSTQPDVTTISFPDGSGGAVEAQLIVVDEFTAPDTGPAYLTSDGDGRVWLVNSKPGNFRIYELTESGTVVTSFATPAGGPQGVAYDGTHLYHADLTGTDTIYRLTLAGAIASSFSAAAFGTANGIQGMTWDGTYLWVGNYLNSRMYQVNTGGSVVSSFALPDAGFNDVVYDPVTGRLWVTSFSTLNLYELELDGTVVNTYALPSQFTAPRGLTFDSNGDFLIGDTDGERVYTVRLLPSSDNAFPRPHDDFDIGDTVSATDWSRNQVSQRVLSIGAQVSDANGAILWTVPLVPDTIAAS